MKYKSKDEAKIASSSEQNPSEKLESLAWAHTPEVTARLEKHLTKNQAPIESDLDAFEARILEQS
jgi:hypothetical protein